jgi:hypothetical protein
MSRRDEHSPKYGSHDKRGSRLERLKCLSLPKGWSTFSDGNQRTTYQGIRAASRMEIRGKTRGNHLRHKTGSGKLLPCGMP